MFNKNCGCLDSISRRVLKCLKQPVWPDKNCQMSIKATTLPTAYYLNALQNVVRTLDWNRLWSPRKVQIVFVNTTPKSAIAIAKTEHYDWLNLNNQIEIWAAAKMVLFSSVPISDVIYLYLLLFAKDLLVNLITRF